MVVVLVHHFERHLPGIVFHVLHISCKVVAARSDERYLAPEYHAAAVGQLVEIAALRIVRKTYHGSSRLADELHVALMVFSGKGATFSIYILMTVKAQQRVMLSVEKESLFGVNREIP